MADTAVRVYEVDMVIHEIPLRIFGKPAMSSARIFGRIGTVIAGGRVSSQTAGNARIRGTIGVHDGS